MKGTQLLVVTGSLIGLLPFLSGESSVIGAPDAPAAQLAFALSSLALSAFLLSTAAAIECRKLVLESRKRTSKTNFEPRLALTG